MGTVRPTPGILPSILITNWMTAGILVMWQAEPLFDSSGVKY